MQCWVPGRPPGSPLHFWSFLLLWLPIFRAKTIITTVVVNAVMQVEIVQLHLNDEIERLLVKNCWR